MLRKLVRRPSHATVVAYLALFVAIGGSGAYAANEWTGENIVDGSLTGQDVFNNTLSGADITNGSLTGQDIFDNTIAGNEITNGSVAGTDVGDSSLTGSDIANNSLDSNDIRDDGVTSDEIFDGGLNANDIAEGNFVRVSGNIGTVPAQGCVSRTISGVDANGDHLLFTPDWVDAHPSLIYQIEYTGGLDHNAHLKVCNWTTSSINDATTHFNLIVIAAQ